MVCDCTQTPKPRTIRKCEAKTFCQPFIFRTPEQNLSPRFYIVGAGIFKNSYNNSLKNVSRQAGSGPTCLTCTCAKLPSCLGEYLPVWLKIFVHFLTHRRYPHRQFLFYTITILCQSFQFHSTHSLCFTPAVTYKF